MARSEPRRGDDACPGEGDAALADEGRADAVLGVDPGLTRCGLALVVGPPSRPRARDVRVVRTSADRPLPARLGALYEGVAGLIAEHRPVAVAVEKVMFSRNVRTAMATGQAAGVVLLAADHAGLPVATYTPTAVKLQVAGHGGAGKDALARMVKAQLGLDELPTPADAADALAVALCHLASSDLTARADAGGRGPTSWEQVVEESPHVRAVGGTS